MLQYGDDLLLSGHILHQESSHLLHAPLHRQAAGSETFYTYQITAFLPELRLH